MSKQQRFVPSKNMPLAWGLGLMALLGLFLVAEPVVAVWSEPTAAPLQGPAKTFLNGSSKEQRKTGSLLLGSSTQLNQSKLCLNPNPAYYISASQNSTYCIDAWGDIASASGPLVRRQENVNVTIQSPTDYGTPDEGFATVTGSAALNQYLSTVVKASSVAGATRYAVYAKDGGINDATSAAQLSGTTIIDSSNPAQNAPLCLNNECITDWSQVAFFTTTGVVRLQPTNTLEADSGGVSVSGVLWLQRGLTAGRPSSITPTDYTSGDGQCTVENGETGSPDCP